MVGLGSIPSKDPAIVKALCPGWREVTRAVQRFAALVPRPRLHLIRFHGVLGPNAKLRCEIISTPAEQASEPSSDHAHAQGAPARMSWARLTQTSLRHRHRTLPQLRRRFEDHRRHRRSASDCHNPRPSGPAYPRRRGTNQELPTARSPELTDAKPQFSPNTRALDDPPIRQYGSRQRKGCLNFYVSNKV